MSDAGMDDRNDLAFFEVVCVILDGGCQSMTALCYERFGFPTNGSDLGSYVLYSLDKPHRLAAIGVAQPSFPGGKYRIGLGVSLWWCHVTGQGRSGHDAQGDQEAYARSLLSRPISLAGMLFERAHFRGPSLVEGEQPCVHLSSPRLPQHAILGRSGYGEVWGPGKDGPRGGMVRLDLPRRCPPWLVAKWQEIQEDRDALLELEALWLSCAACTAPVGLIGDWFERRDVPAIHSDFFAWRLS